MKLAIMRHCCRLRMLRDGGVIHRLQVTNWPFPEQYEPQSSIVGVDLSSVAPLLLLLASSVVVSAAVLLAERGHFALWRARLGGRTRWERIASRQRSVLCAAKPPKRPQPAGNTRPFQ
jgi:hypothetical protein